MRMREQAAQRRGVEPASARGDEQCVLRAAHELRTCVAEIEREPVRCFLAEGNDALLPALAAYVQLLLLEVDVREIEIDRLAAAQARGVHELEQRAVSQRERLVS